MLKTYAPVVLVFFFFATIAFAVYMQSDAPYSSDDPYYHAYRASALWRGEEPHVPVYSTLQTKPVTFYTLYYVTMAPFTAAFDGTNYEALIVGTKIYHALLVGCLYVVLYVVARYILKDTRYALVTTLCMFALSSIFAFRSILPRPHLISVILVLLCVYYALRNKPWALFIINVISPFTYSVSFFTIIPGFVLGLMQRKVTPILASVGGLIVGIIVRPDSSNYFYNGTGLHLMSIVRTSFLGHTGPGELTAGTVPLRHELWMFAYMFVLAYAIVSYMIRKDTENRISWDFQELYLLALSFLFYIPFIFIQRTIEYTLPLCMLTIIALWRYHLTPLIKRCKLSYASTPYVSRLAEVLVNGGRELLADLYARRKVLGVLFLLYISVSTAQIVYARSLAAQTQNPMVVYEQLSEYLKTHSEEGDLVFYQDFALYTRLVFFNTHNTYPMGMDPIFTYAYDEQKYWAWYHLTTSSTGCVYKECATTEDIYEVLTKTLGARYILMHLEQRPGYNQPEVLAAKLAQDNRFELVYEDAEFKLKLFRILTSPSDI